MSPSHHRPPSANQQLALAPIQPITADPRPAPAPQRAPDTPESTPRVDLTLPLVDADYIAELLCVKRKRIYELARRPDDPLPSVRIGRAVRFARQQVEEWVAGQARG